MQINAPSLGFLQQSAANVTFYLHGTEGVFSRPLYPHAKCLSFERRPPSPMSTAINVIEITQGISAHSSNFRDARHTGEQVRNCGRTLVVLTRHKDFKIVPLLQHSGFRIEAAQQDAQVFSKLAAHSLTHGAAFNGDFGKEFKDEFHAVVSIVKGAAHQNDSHIIGVHQIKSLFWCNFLRRFCQSPTKLWPLAKCQIMAYNLPQVTPLVVLAYWSRNS